MVALKYDVRNRALGVRPNQRAIAPTGFGIGGAPLADGVSAGKFREFGSPFSCELWDDFMSFDTSRWTAVLGSAPPSSPAVVATTASGVLRLTAGSSVGSVAADGVQIVNGRYWLASSGNLAMEFRVKLGSISSVSAFIGFTDKLTLQAPIQSAASSNTITTNATDGVGVMFDTSMSSAHWWMVGVANDVDATAQDAGVAPVAGTYETWRIEISTSGVATFYRNGVLIGTTMTGAVTPGTALVPTAIVWPRSATAGKTLDIDYAHVSVDRV